MLLKRFLGNIAKATLAIGALSVSAFAVANEAYPYGGHEFYGHDMYSGQCGSPCELPCNPVCSTADHCCGQPCNPPPSCNWGYNPPAYPRCGGCCDSDGGWLDSLGFRVDFLWWRPSVECLELGVEEFFTASPVVGTETEFFNAYDVKRPKYKYDPGFRLGLAHVCPCDCWDVMLNWTHFHSKANVSGASDFDFTGATIPAASTFTLFTPYWERVIGAFPDVSSGHWTLNMDLLDLEFGSKYFVCSCFAVRPSIGLRGARIDQSFRVASYANRTVATPFAPFDDFASLVRAKSDFLGVGPRVGLQAELDLGCGIAIFGEAAGSLLFGRYDRHSREFFEYLTTTTTGTTSTEYEFETHGSPERSTLATTDLSIGLKWCHCFNWCNRLHPVSLAISWEHHGFFDATRFDFPGQSFDLATFTAGDGFNEDGESHCHPSNLFTQGVTASICIGF